MLDRLGVVIEVGDMLTVFIIQTLLTTIFKRGDMHNSIDKAVFSKITHSIPMRTRVGFVIGI